jgi:hypothetical protein
MQPPPGRLAPCLLVEVFQNARALFWRQCGLFSDRLDSFTWPRLRQRFFISLWHVGRRFADGSCGLLPDLWESGLA